jgi:class 3 adenylate cyclase/DNA-binding SARP family transcriptional activator/tetratricopeptide (TPR) repeat protein
VEFGILGPLAIWQNGREVELGAAKQRMLLAVLLLHADEAMSTERLADALWGENLPDRPKKGIQVRVAEIRKALGADVIETHPLGYIVRLGEHTLDLRRFEQLLAEGQRLLDEGAPHEARRTLCEALALWRGEPLADFRYDAFAENETGRLSELRLIALEHRLEADLAVGRSAECVPELEALVRQHPLREGLRRLLMLALYRSGRQADALAVMHDTRTTLREELGLEPSPALQQLEKLILLQDPSLDEGIVPAPPVEPPAPAPSEPPAASETPLPAARAQRKVVTVLFADVTDSTLLGESYDPEVVRAMLAEYFERMRTAAERHGGVVEKFIGDAVMAVFGIPSVHEDDALRALRAALEMREAIVELGMEGRVGVESGECVVGTAERLVTGRAVTTAARLEQAAPPGEILIGRGTMELARDCVVAEELAPLVLKGKPEPVRAWRLLSVSNEGPAPDFDSPFLGRDAELQRLVDTWSRVQAGERCELVTIAGAAGLGKSRLVSELTSSIDATVAHGRCLSYGAGITYWPVLEMLTQLQPQLDLLEAAIAAPLRALLEGAGTSSTDELAWAFRKLVEAVAHERPLVLVFDDIHWAEEALLDLIEHVAFVSSGAPILLLCMARPELLDRRPGWRGLLTLEPLSTEQTEELIRTRLGDDPGAGVADRIVAAAEGNPLFVEEIAAMLQASDAKVRVPPTIHALLGARLDQLDSRERSVLEAAAVEGEVFHRGAVETLTATDPGLTAVLTALVRKEYIRPDRPALEGEDGFRFRHLLLRDATYDAIPKATRTELHERYADWIEQRPEPLDAFVGYHLEQAYLYRVELRDASRETDALARRASDRLRDAATTALGRSDLVAAAGLLRRSSSLPPVSNDRRSRLLCALAATLMESGETDEAETALREATTLAAASSDHCAEARVLIERQALEHQRATPGAADGVEDLVLRAIPVLESAGDEQGLCRAWSLRASSSWAFGRVSEAAEAWARAAGHAERSGEAHARATMLEWIAWSTWLGATEVEAAIARCDEIRAAVREHACASAEVLRPLAGLHAYAGRFDLARSLFAECNAAYDDLGLAFRRALTHTEAVVEMLAGDVARAESLLRTACNVLEGTGDNSRGSTAFALLARALEARGFADEAEVYAKDCLALAEPSDLVTQILARGVRARLLAARGEVDRAEAVAREAVAIAARTEFLNFRADALVDLAVVLGQGLRPSDAPPLMAEALELYEAKGNVVAAESVRASLDALAAV